MQDKLVKYRGLECDHCGKEQHSEDFHQVHLPHLYGIENDGYIYLCKRCYRKYDEVERE